MVVNPNHPAPNSPNTTSEIEYNSAISDLDNNPFGGFALIQIILSSMPSASIKRFANFKSFSPLSISISREFPSIFFENCAKAFIATSLPFIWPIQTF
jgi:hypothetical protein